MISLLLFIFSSVAFSSNDVKVVIAPEAECLGQRIQVIHNSITDYANYRKMEGAKLQFLLPLLKMYVSTPEYIVPEDYSKLQKISPTEAYVHVRMQPYNLLQTELYPKFILHCTSSWSTPKKFHHHCEMMKDTKFYETAKLLKRPHVKNDVDLKEEKYPFGLTDFSSDLDVEENSGLCRTKKDQSTWMKFVFNMLGNLDDDKKIEDAIIAQLKEEYPNLGKLVTHIKDLFHEDSFFKLYYTGFYKKWLASIKKIN